MDYLLEQINIIKKSLHIFNLSSDNLIELKKKVKILSNSNIKVLSDIGCVIDKFLSQTKRIRNTNKFIFIPRILVNNDRIYVNNFHTFKDEVVKNAFEIILQEINKNIIVKYVDINASLVRFFIDNYKEYLKEKIVNFTLSQNNDVDIYLKIIEINNLKNIDREKIKLYLIKMLTKILYKKPLNDNDYYYYYLIAKDGKLLDLDINSKDYWKWVWNKQKEILLNSHKDLSKIKIIYINGDGLIYLE